MNSEVQLVDAAARSRPTEDMVQLTARSWVSQRLQLMINVSNCNIMWFSTSALLSGKLVFMSVPLLGGRRRVEYVNVLRKLGYDMEIIPVCT
jgi:hypothetical protein